MYFSMAYIFIGFYSALINTLTLESYALAFISVYIVYAKFSHILMIEEQSIPNGIARIILVVFMLFMVFVVIHTDILSNNARMTHPESTDQNQGRLITTVTDYDEYEREREITGKVLQWEEPKDNNLGRLIISIDETHINESSYRFIMPTKIFEDTRTIAIDDKVRVEYIEYTIYPDARVLLVLEIEKIDPGDNPDAEYKIE